MPDRVSNVLDGCAYLSCVGSFMIWLLSTVNSYAPAFGILIAFLSWLTSIYFKRLHYKLAKSRLEEEIDLISGD